MNARGQILTSANTQLWGVGDSGGLRQPQSVLNLDEQSDKDLPRSIRDRPMFAGNRLQLPPVSLAAIARYVDAGVSENTRRAYRQDLEDFQRWGGAVPCPSQVVAAYLADRAQCLAPATLVRRVVGIARAHTAQGLPDPTKDELVRRVLRGIRRVKGCAQRQAAPLLIKDLSLMVERMHGLAGCRDRALVLLGFAAALRRSELAGLHVGDVEFVPQGVIVHVRRSKTDQAGLGRRIAVTPGRSGTCPVAAVREWLAISGIDDGPIFRPINRYGVLGAGQLSGQSVSLIVKGHARLVGLDAATFSGHSLRAGLVTSAIQAGVGIHKIQQQTGHKSLDMLARYIRDSNIFDENASGAVL